MTRDLTQPAAACSCQIHRRHGEGSGDLLHCILGRRAEHRGSQTCLLLT